MLSNCDVFEICNTDSEHDMMVDYDQHVNTDELPEVFNDESLNNDEYVNISRQISRN